ncbi:hypothetical protein UFOVP673_40 [uncultured Caudovirales phage]|uniref:Uncharacterized protein n=1 Tax=uncultured Caudovirales phage TaxID=2100421 RepID=A0A6J5NBU9_9CAUD|nr:hypothetical protein UFOVP673_40 [uncultured Caudovirales phage]
MNTTPPPTPTNDGGPAFPCEVYICPQDTEPSKFSGMSLRDWFAGQALNGYLASWSDDSDPIFFEPCHTAKTSYAYADAMLAAREVQS